MGEKGRNGNNRPHKTPIQATSAARPLVRSNRIVSETLICRSCGRQGETGKEPEAKPLLSNATEVVMSLSRSAIAFLGAGILGIAGIGLGAGASFTTSTASAQTITAGAPHVSVWASGNACGSAAANCTSITLPTVGPVGSTFETPATRVYITNTGNIPAIYDAMQMSETNDGSTASAYLRAQTNVCMRGWDPSVGGLAAGAWVEGNGPLTKAISLTPSVKENKVVLGVGETNWYEVNFYAGQDSKCGGVSSDGPNTASIWGSYTMPASLTNAAEGGVVTPTMTFSFTG